jgi:hypothetical protein
VAVNAHQHGGDLLIEPAPEHVDARGFSFFDNAWDSSEAIASPAALSTIASLGKEIRYFVMRLMMGRRLQGGKGWTQSLALRIRKKSDSH